MLFSLLLALHALPQGGAGCPGFSGIVPELELTSVNQGFTSLARATGAPSTQSLLLVGFDDSAYLGWPLPLALGSVVPELAGCSLTVAPLSLIPLPLNAAGEATLPVMGWTAGLTVHLQLWNLDVDLVGASDFGGFSDGLSVTSGSFSGPLLSTEIYSVGDRPEAMAAADWTGDGELDLLVANWMSDDLSMLIGRGEGQFEEQVPVFVGNSPPPTGNRNVDVEAGDFNGDGFQDFVVAKRLDASELVVRLGRGDGTFEPLTAYPSGSSTDSVEVADVNSDGVLDLVAVNQGTAGSLLVLIGLGDGSFAPASQQPLPQPARALHTADVDLDGNVDLVYLLVTSTISPPPQTLAVHLGAGDGSFPLSSLNELDADGVGTLCVGDVDLDGAPDLVTARFSDDRIAVRLGTGTGAFGPSLLSQGPEQLKFDMALAKLDSDDFPDLIVARDFNAALFRGLGDGTFEIDQAPVATAAFPHAPVVADFNGDSRADLAVTGSTSNAVTISLGLGFASSPASVSPDLTSRTSGIAAGDVNGDGRLDLAVSSTFFGANVALAGEDGSFVESAEFNVGGVSGLAFADLDQDSNLDLALTETVLDSVRVYSGAGDGSFAAPASYPVGQDPQMLGFADLNGDNRLDLVTANQASNDISVLLANPSGGFQPAQGYSAGVGPRSLVLADLDEDGDLDVLTANRFSEDLTLLRGNGQGGFTPPENFGFLLDTDPWGVTVGDFDRDGIPDLATANNESDDVAIRLGLGGGTFGSPQFFPAGAQPTAIRTNDLNQDGLLDLAVANEASDDVSLLLGVGDGTFELEGRYLAAEDGGVSGEDEAPEILLADFDDDGQLDILQCNGGLTGPGVTLIYNRLLH